MKIKLFNEKTGHPLVDNRNRRKNKALDQIAYMKVKARNRRRRKYIKRIERPLYASLINAVAEQLWKERHTYSD